MFPRQLFLLTKYIHEHIIFLKVHRWYINSYFSVFYWFLLGLSVSIVSLLSHELLVCLRYWNVKKILPLAAFSLFPRFRYYTEKNNQTNLYRFYTDGVCVWQASRNLVITAPKKMSLWAVEIEDCLPKGWDSSFLLILNRTLFSESF